MINFYGTVINATLYLVEDAARDSVFVGITLEDENNAADYIRIYQEQEAAYPGNTYDVLLDDDRENCLELKADNSFADLYYEDGATQFLPGTWDLRSRYYF